MQKEELQTYHFIDGDFEMDINVSIEERTIYMTQKEMANFLGVSKATISNRINENHDFQMGQVYENAKNVNSVYSRTSIFYPLEIIKEIGEKYNKERIEKLEKWLEEIIIENTQEVMDENFEIVRYNQDNINIPIRINRNSKEIWLTQKEIADLFGTTKQNVNFHINNIYDDKELTKNSVVKDYLTTASDGKMYNMTFYNLDMILAVGYRTRTSKAIAFRRWASDIIERFLDEGFNNFDTRLTALEASQIILTSEMSENRKELISLKEEVSELKPKHIAFLRNRAYDAYLFLSIFVSTAVENVFIIDPYSDRFTLAILSNISENLMITIVVGKNGNITKEELEIFQKAHPQSTIKILRNDNEHDRYIFIDSRYGYSLGSSPNSLGYYNFDLIKVDDISFIKSKIKAYTIEEKQ